jgi:hypothetical protein
MDPITADDLETTVTAPISESCWYQPASSGGRYWHQNDAGRWVHKNAGQFERWLQVKGLQKYIQKGEVRILSEIDELLTLLETERLIDYAGGLAGWRSGIHELNKNIILVTQDPDLIQPVPLDPIPQDADMWDMAAWGFPILGQFFTGLFNGIDRDGDVEEVTEQLPLFVTWLWHFLRSIYNCQYSTGLAFAMAGEPECGKTLLAAIIQRLTGGIVARPYRYMVGQDNFNEEWLGAPLLLVDDENSNTHITERLKFASEAKQIVATRGTRIRGLHQKAMLLHPIQRLMICVNLEPERIQVLPPIDTDIKDKFLVLKGYSQPMPMPTRTPDEQEAFWKVLEDEMPAMLWWILNVYQPDLENLGRFGPRAWQHPAILEELSKLNPEARTMEFIQRMLDKNPRIDSNSLLNRCSADDRARLGKIIDARGGSIVGYIGTVSELRSVLVSDGEDAPLSMLERREVRATAYLGRDLSALSRANPNTIFQTRPPGNGSRNWIIIQEGELK